MLMVLVVALAAGFLVTTVLTLVLLLGTAYWDVLELAGLEESSDHVRLAARRNIPIWLMRVHEARKVSSTRVCKGFSGGRSGSN